MTTNNIYRLILGCLISFTLILVIGETFALRDPSTHWAIKIVLFPILIVTSFLITIIAVSQHEMVKRYEEARKKAECHISRNHN